MAQSNTLIVLTGSHQLKGSLPPREDLTPQEKRDAANAPFPAFINALRHFPFAPLDAISMPKRAEGGNICQNQPGPSAFLEGIAFKRARGRDENVLKRTIKPHLLITFAQNDKTRLGCFIFMEGEEKKNMHLSLILTSSLVYLICFWCWTPGSSPTCGEKPCHYCGNPGEQDNASRFNRSPLGSPGNKRLWVERETERGQAILGLCPGQVKRSQSSGTRCRLLRCLTGN